MATAKKTPAKKTAAKKSAPKAAPKKTVTPKKAAPAKKAAPKAEAPAWSTIHVFGYGESQVIGSKANGKVANGALKALAPLYVALAKKQQKGTKINLDSTHALNIFNGSHIDYRPRMGSGMGQRIAWADADTKAIGKLADELMSKAPKDNAGAMLRGLFKTHEMPAMAMAKKAAAPKKEGRSKKSAMK